VSVVNETTKLAVELSRSTMRDQADRLRDLRTRTGMLLASASIAGSFSGATRGVLDTYAVCALFAYLICVGACLYVLMPHTLATEFRGSVLLKTAHEADATDQEAYEAVVPWIEQVRDENAIKLDDLTRWYAVGAVALGFEVTLWILALAA
jgi:hypothetical protein